MSPALEMAIGAGLLAWVVFTAGVLFGARREASGLPESPADLPPAPRFHVWRLEWPPGDGAVLQLYRMRGHDDDWVGSVRLVEGTWEAWCSYQGGATVTATSMKAAAGALLSALPASAVSHG
jgi:hypothetical protein